MLTRRLKSIAGLIVKEDNVIDIGCDHALLPIYLIKNNITENVIASDINSNAIKNAIKNIKKNNLEDKIEIKVGDGLDTVNSNTNTAVISGLGSATIIKILTHDNLKQIDKLIIQSNSDQYILRSFLVLKGYYIDHESFVYEKGHYYINIVFKKGYKKYNIKELIYGPVLMKSNKEYYEHLLKKKTAIIENIPNYKVFLKLKHYRDKIYLKRLIKKIPQVN